MKGREWLIHRLLVVVAFSSLSLLGLIAVFIFAGGIPIMAQVGLGEFLAGTRWAPTRGHFGILPMIVGSLWVTAGALVLGVPVALACAMYLSEVASEGVGRVVKPALELLAGIPSVVYGFLGLVLLVPLIRQFLGGPGFSVLAAACVLAVMILPTVTSVSYDALRAVPPTYREGSLALGATRWQTISMSVLPAARSGILAGVILGMGRAVGETMAVIMVAGNATLVPVSPLDPVRTLTSNIALELGYAAGKHREALFATGVVLFLIIMVLNLVAGAVAGRGKSR
ncbi:MAG: phosphate ABC transporter permease subunit PstC [Bacillota bacterium]|nr:phosphate ABC transporter permease subunit PstC [Bacillota bacterium]